jgi:signal recognition particle receptor subunit beta
MQQQIEKPVSTRALVIWAASTVAAVALAVGLGAALQGRGQQTTPFPLPGQERFSGVIRVCFQNKDSTWYVMVSSDSPRRNVDCSAVPHPGWTLEKGQHVTLIGTPGSFAEGSRPDTFTNARILKD